MNNSWKGRYNPAGEAAFREKLKDPDNPIRRVYDMLFEGAKQMIRDGRMKIVDGVPVFSEEVKQILRDRDARLHARCTEADPCRGLKAAPKTLPGASQTPSRSPRRARSSPDKKE